MDKERNLRALHLSHGLWALRQRSGIMNKTVLGHSVFHVLALSTLNDSVVTMKSLTADCSVAPSVLRRFIRDLEAQGWVASETHVDDSRLRVVAPTSMLNDVVSKYATDCQNLLVGISNEYGSETGFGLL